MVVLMLCCCLVELPLAILMVVLPCFSKFYGFLWAQGKKIEDKNNVKVGVDII
jgi:hypothetical protein